MLIMASSSEVRVIKKIIKSVWEFKEGEKQRLKNLQVEYESQRIKDATCP